MARERARELDDAVVRPGKIRPARACRPAGRGGALRDLPPRNSTATGRSRRHPRARGTDRRNDRSSDRARDRGRGTRRDRALDRRTSEPIDQQALLAALAGAGAATGRPSRTGPGTTSCSPRPSSRTPAAPAARHTPGEGARARIDPPSGGCSRDRPAQGKTTVAKGARCAGGLLVLSVSAADLLSKWVVIRDERATPLARARDNAPSIVFIDEIDAVGAVAQRRVGAQSAQRALTEIDGMGSHGRVLVVAATTGRNCSTGARPRGRLSRTIVLPLPTSPRGSSSLTLQSRKMPLEDVDLAAIAQATTASPAPISRRCASRPRSQRSRCDAKRREADRHARGLRARVQRAPGLHARRHAGTQYMSTTVDTPSRR